MSRRGEWAAVRNIPSYVTYETVNGAEDGSRVDADFARTDSLHGHAGALVAVRNRPLDRGRAAVLREHGGVDVERVRKGREQRGGNDVPERRGQQEMRRVVRREWLREGVTVPQACFRNVRSRQAPVDGKGLEWSCRQNSRRSSYLGIPLIRTEIQLGPASANTPLAWGEHNDTLPSVCRQQEHKT